MLVDAFIPVDQMNFLIADTFTDSLAKLTGEEQKAVKTTAFDLQMNPATTGMRLHKLDGAKDKNFWSVSVNMDIRLIVHKTPSSLLLCYVDHHDKAYAWAVRRKLETHPKTGAAQLVEVREMVQEIMVPLYVPQNVPAPPKSPVFMGVSEDELLGYGVPRGNGWRMLKPRPRIRSSCWRIVCRMKLPRRCWSWRRAASRRRPRSQSPKSIRSSIRMHSAVSA